MRTLQPPSADLAADPVEKSLEALAGDVVDGYQQVRSTIDVTGTLFARHELQVALIEVRRQLRRLNRSAAATDAESASIS